MTTKSTKAVVIILLLLLQFTVKAQQKRIYVANDDHTDYMWTADEAAYKDAFLNMLDWWIQYNDSTAIANPNPYYQSKWTCDGAFWVSVYEKNRSASDFNKLISQIKNGQITVPYSPLIANYGAVPAEAVLRGMYYAGDLERRYNLKLNMATAMENQTLPLGLASLWKGSGAKYCWYGVCDCATSIFDLGSRQNEMYWYKGKDTNKVLLKWYNIESGNDYLGGYAEARFIDDAINGLSAKINTVAYPYNIAAGFGVGHDDVETTKDNLVETAKAKTNASQQVIVSNEVDFFQDFENTYGASLPSATQTFGNEWDLACAAIAEVSAKVKRSLEKLRAAEAMAAIAVNYNPVFMHPLDSLKKEAWDALGLYWEHSLGGGGNVGIAERNAFQRRLETTITSYVDQLYNLAKSNLGNLVANNSGRQRFFAFNPLGWNRTDYADYAYTGSANIHVVDVNTNADVPFQFVTKAGINYLRIEASNIPSVGYKVFEIQDGPGTIFPATGTNTGNVLENGFFKIAYTNQGVLTSVIDKQNGNREIAIVTNGKYINDLGTGTASDGTSSIESNGPVSITIVTNTTAVPLAHSTRITLFKNVPRIEIDNQITQNFTSTNTWSYSFDIASPTVWHEETGAVIKAKLTSNGGDYATQNARYDWSTLGHFATVNNAAGNYSVTLSNQDCYFMKVGNSSVAALDENTAQLNVLAGGMIDGQGIPDQGDDNIFNQRFAITTHTAYSATAEMKKSLEHQNFMVCGALTNPSGFLPTNQYSFVSNSDQGSLLWALKPSEEGINNGIIARVWNLSNTDATPALTFDLSISDAKRSTHVETDMNNNAFSGKNLLTAIGHDEMKTFRVKLMQVPLPVKLLLFNGDKIQGLNMLKWKTTGEISFKKYELQRSTDGQQFTTITSAAAKLGSINSYEFTDKNINAGTPYYYRLKMINGDNSFNYSETILIKADKAASNIVLYPNPVNNVLKINFILDKQTRCNVNVINTAGVVIKTVAPPLFERGNNYYTLPVKDLPAGEYIVTVEAGDKKFIKAFIKQ
jgi:alpha-mannosidase